MKNKKIIFALFIMLFDASLLIAHMADLVEITRTFGVCLIFLLFISAYLIGSIKRSDRPSCHRQIVPGKSDAFNQGYQSYLIQRELSNNPFSAGTVAYNDWSDGYSTALKSVNKIDFESQT